MTMIKNDTITANVFKKGFGVAPYLLISEQDLHTTSKVIYCVLSSFRKKGSNKVYPCVYTVVKMLGINENTFYKHFKELVKFGWVSREYDKFLKRETFLLNDKPSKFLDSTKRIDRKVVESDVFCLGIVPVPKAVMQDTIKLQSKLLFEYLLFKQGTKDYVELTVDKICKDISLSKALYNKASKELVAKGYLNITRIHKNGRFTNSSYTISTVPEVRKIGIEVVRCVTNNTQQSNQQFSTNSTEFSVSNKNFEKKQDIQNQDKQNCGSYINIKPNNNIINNNIINQSLTSLSQDGISEKKINVEKKSYIPYCQKIKNLLEYLHNYGDTINLNVITQLEIKDEIIKKLADFEQNSEYTLCSDFPVDNIELREYQSKIFKLTVESISQQLGQYQADFLNDLISIKGSIMPFIYKVVERVYNVKKEIRNLKAYIQVVVKRAFTEKLGLIEQEENQYKCYYNYKKKPLSAGWVGWR